MVIDISVFLSHCVRLQHSEYMKYKLHSVKHVDVADAEIEIANITSTNSVVFVNGSQ